MKSAAPASISVATSGTTDARVNPDERLAVSFGKHIARWARQQDASPLAASLAQRAALYVSHATSNGHSCLGLDDLLESLNADRSDDTAPLDLPALRAQLLESKVVGTADAPGSLPLILDDQRLYLHRYFDYECRLATSLRERGAARPPPNVGADNDAGNSAGAGAAAVGVTVAGTVGELPLHVVALLDTLFAANALDAGTPDWQKIAAITALLGRLTIISGGPGTGKTTTVVNLLACLLEANPECRIALTAPTGKAAARMTEVILQRAGHLPDTLRAQLPTEASTIHRLLGGLPNGEFRHHAGNELPIDVLVVDEASMLDLALAVHLIDAVPTDARIILLGDKDQLAAVESGAVFSELSAQPTFSASRLDTLSHLTGTAPQTLQPQQALGAPAAPKKKKTTKTAKTTEAPQLDLLFNAEPQTRLQDSVIWLRRNYRFAVGSAIGLLATETNNGNAARVLEQLKNPPQPSLRWLHDEGRVPSTESMQAILDGYSPYLDAVRSHGSDPASITAAFARFRVLCAVRNGPWGVDAINLQVTTHFRRTLQHPFDPGMRSEWYPGRPVMVLRNDNVLKLFNGDIGIVLPDPEGALQVYFPAEAGAFRAIAPVRLPEHETAFAMTVHKSQGSEFDEVLLLLPSEKNKVLTRELLYTAVSRARERLTLVATSAIVTSTIETTTKRVSGLLARMQKHR